MKNDNAKFKKIRFDIVTIFPGLVEPYFKDSILARAIKRKLIKVCVHDLRDFTIDKHRTTDDAPYGGGPGMVMKVEPIFRAMKSLVKFKIQKSKCKMTSQNAKIVLLSARGRQFDEQKARDFSKLKRLILICGRYEGVDQRVTDFIADEEVSVGPYILSGGEIGALTVVEATARLIPGVLGNKDSSNDPGWSQYTRPAIYKPNQRASWRVPDVLFSGDHKRIMTWRNSYLHRTNQ